MGASPHLTPLATLPPGVSARIAEIRGGRALTHKLFGLGLRVGSRVLVLHRRGHGLVLSSAETRLAIGGGIADKLWVEPIWPSAETERPSDPNLRGAA
jgi:ferrous iron transport protein A